MQYRRINCIDINGGYVKKWFIFPKISFFSFRLNTNEPPSLIHLHVFSGILVLTQTPDSNAQSIVFGVIKTYLVCLLTQTYLCFSALITFSISIRFRWIFRKFIPLATYVQCNMLLFFALSVRCINCSFSYFSSFSIFCSMHKLCLSFWCNIASVYLGVRGS